MPVTVVGLGRGERKDAGAALLLSSRGEPGACTVTAQSEVSRGQCASIYHLCWFDSERYVCLTVLGTTFLLPLESDLIGSLGLSASERSSRMYPVLSLDKTRNGCIIGSSPQPGVGVGCWR